MTELLDRAVETVRKLSAESQDEIARAMLQLANNEEPEQIPPEHLSAVLEGLAQAKKRQYASVEEVEAVFRRFDS